MCFSGRKWNTTEEKYKIFHIHDRNMVTHKDWDKHRNVLLDTI